MLATYTSRPLLLARDLNQDRRADLVVVRGTYPTFELILFEGRADGTLVRRREFTPLIPSCSPTGIVAEDLNSDGLVDMAVSCLNMRDGVISVIGSGNFSFYRGYTASFGAQGGQLAARDLDGDGFPELLMASPEHHAVCVLPSWGHGQFGISSCFGTLNTPHDLALLDVDHDGVPEVLTGGGFLPSSGTTLLRIR
ncbi:FG-GAP repeat domain-containing protein [Myxococcus sp. 1LA]